MWGQSLTDLFLRGGAVMWPLLACSVVVVAIALERAILWVRLRFDFNAFIARLRPLVSQGRLEEAAREAIRYRGPIADMTAAYLRLAGATSELRQEILQREASQQLVRLEKRLNWLSVIGQLAPMLGLLGTVTGLVTAFWQIEVKAGHVQPGDLASGIWEALLTTVFGLVIAVPTIAVHHYFDRKVGLIECRMQWLVAYLDEWMAESLGLGASAQPSRVRRATTASSVP